MFIPIALLISTFLAQYRYLHAKKIIRFKETSRLLMFVLRITYCLITANV